MTYKCPSCENTNVLLVAEQSFLANTVEHYCFSVKIQDSDAKSWCLDCEWRGEHSDLIGYEEH